MSILSNLTAIKIRGTYTHQGEVSSLIKNLLEEINIINYVSRVIR